MTINAISIERYENQLDHVYRALQIEHQTEKNTCLQDVFNDTEQHRGKNCNLDIQTGIKN